jgi:hypothetical protein
MAVRVCLWCATSMPGSNTILSHGDSIVICPNCSARYNSVLLVTIPKAVWTQMANRQGWTVTRDEGSNVLQFTEA